MATLIIAAFVGLGSAFAVISLGCLIAWHVEAHEQVTE